MNGNDRYKHYRSLGFNQSQAMAKSVEDVAKWAQENGYATNKPNTKKK